MATKSVIEIDVLDEKFQAFVKEFDKLKKSLDNMPKAWDKTTSSGVKSTQAVSKNIQEAKKKQEDFNKAVKDGSQAISNIANTTANIAKNMSGALVSFTKFVALGAIGGGFGFAKLGASASNERRQAQGLGVSRGQLLTAETFGNRYIDTDKVLKNLADTLSNPARLIEFQKFGVMNTKGKNAFEVLPDVIEKAVDYFKMFSGMPQPLESLGITEKIDYESLRRLASLPKEELKKFLEDLRKVDPVLATSDEIDEAWQRFTRDLNKAGKAVEIAIATGFEKLPNPLGKLSDAISKAIKVFLESPQIGEFIDYTAKKIEQFGNYLASPEVKEDINQFLEGVKKVSNALAGFAKWIGNLFPSQAELDERERVYKEKKEEEARQPAKPFSFRRFEELFLGRKPVEPSDALKQPATKQQKFFTALEQVKKDYKEMTGQDLPITSLSRTRAEQQDLYDRYKRGEKGIFKPLNPADYPGRELFHENSVDISINRMRQGFPMKEFMEARGFKGGSKSDPVHYDYVDALYELGQRQKRELGTVVIENQTGNDINTRSNLLQTPRGPN